MENIQLLRVGNKQYRHYQDPNQITTVVSKKVISMEQIEDEDDDSIGVSKTVVTTSSIISEEAEEQISNVSKPQTSVEVFFEYPSDIPITFLSPHVKSQIEKETKCKIFFAKDGKKNGFYIKSSSQEYISSQEPTIIQILKNSLSKSEEKKSAYTHFISIPLCNSSSVQQLLRMVYDQIQTQILNSEPTFDKSLFMPIEKFHITCCMLSIESEEKKKAILECLEKEISPLMKKFVTEYTMIMSKLGFFGKENSKTRVVYIDVSESSKQVKIQLENFVKAMKQVFFEKKLISKIELQEEFTLHSTILNTKYRRGPKRMDLNAKALFDLVDAKKEWFLLEDLKVEFKTLELSKLETDPKTKYYVKEGSVNWQ